MREPACDATAGGGSAMDQQGIEPLYRRLGYAFRDGALVRLALTHTSFSNENPRQAPQHNERLEFLGDAVLDFVISDLLMTRYPALSEGDLSKMRAGLVSETALAAIARELELGPCLLMGRGEEQSGGRDKDSILSNALEALLAAVYLDSAPAGGLASIQQVVRDLFEPRLEEAGRPRQLEDFKTELQELVQSRYKDTVHYEITAELGPDHDKHFEAAVFFRDRELGRGSGRSKKQAEQNAARLALQAMKPAARELRP
jgi:ribonuclease III